jgi:hypothetical protein
VSIIANTLGIEGGIIFIPVFVLGLGLTAQEAAGVSLTTMIFGLGSGSLAYALQKRIDYKLSLLLGDSTIPGAILGAWTTQFVSSNVLKLLFGLTLIPLAIRMIMENRGALENVKETGQGKWKRRLIDRDGKDFTYAVNHPLLGVGAYFLIFRPALVILATKWPRGTVYNAIVKLNTPIIGSIASKAPSDMLYPTG